MKAEMFNYQEWIKETDPERLHSYFNSILIKSGFEVIRFIDKHFSPYGWTCLYLLGESHLAIHTFPEEGKSYIELSSCVKKPFDLFIGLNND